MDSFLDRLKESWVSVNLAATAAGVGMVLVATGIQAVVLTALRGADPNPIPTVRELINSAPEYWQLFRQTAPLTLSITLISAVLWPAKPKTRPPRNERELVQSILHKGPHIAEIVLLVLAALIALSLAVWIGRLDVWRQPDLIEPRPLGPVNIIIGVINLLGKFYYAYGYDSFWSSMVLGVCLGALLRSLAVTWGPRRVA
jgi:hypothetical protein